MSEFNSSFSKPSEGYPINKSQGYDNLHNNVGGGKVRSYSGAVASNFKEKQQSSSKMDQKVKSLKMSDNTPAALRPIYNQIEIWDKNNKSYNPGQFYAYKLFDKK